VDRSSHARRSAFTLVELLVVIAIIGVLVALLLPAVQAARESARRTQCSNQLKQMGLACQNFHDTYQFLPGSRIWDHWATWAVQILPYMEQQNLYNQWDITDMYYNQPLAVRQAQVPGYYCPSRRRPGGISKQGDVPDNGSPNSSHNPGALSDYAGCAGDFNYASWFDSVNANGTIRTGERVTTSGTKVLQWKGMVRLSTITDGTSNTLLIGEKHVPLDKFGSGNGDGSIYNGDHEWNFARVAGPGYPLALSPKDQNRWTLVFGSFHPSTCQFVFADGSVHMLKINIDTTTLGRLAVRDDGLTIGEF
jgi:prepilin-type N-terminal cleavage/methylation domain-containing protein